MTSKSAVLRCVAACAALLAASPARALDSLEPPGWDASLRLPDAPDLNPDPRVVEINIDARIAPVEITPGRRVDAWTYNGGIPGPLVRVHVGDRLIVHFTNHLPQETTIHWHGLRIPIQMDGVPEVSQPPVPNGGTFTYDFVVPDAGLYWYHPHVMSAAQVGFGLYGALLVEDPAEQLQVADQTVLVLSDIGLDEHGGFESPTSGGSTGMAFGREGNQVLVNGRVRPTLRMRSGVPQRWRIVNAAKSRYFNVDLDGETFTRIGGDGGFIEAPITSDTLLLAPGERADVLVAPRRAPGKEIDVRTIPFNRGYGSVEFRNAEELMTIAVDSAPALRSPALSTLLPAPRKIEPISTAGATSVNIDFTIAQLGDGTFVYGVSGVPFSRNRPIVAKPGETQVWTITNKTKWSHPFHLHGFFFQVLDDQGRQVRPLEWKDTVNVPFEETVRLVVTYDDRIGNWMFHCHILDHADGGLMGMVDLGVPSKDHLEHGHH